MINEKRFKAEFVEISKFGAIKEDRYLDNGVLSGGLTRLAFSDEEKEARKYLESLALEAELKYKTDEVGNIFIRYDDVIEPNLPAVSAGSHIDSVPNGGFYDGTLGVMAGLEAIKSIKDSGKKLKRPLELIIFACEESSRFKMATVGSKLIAGKLNLDQLNFLKDKNGISLFDAMRNFGLSPNKYYNAVLEQSTYKSYLELHIEQGPVLENHNISVGIVTGIAAPIRYELKIYGRADHSGATPMNMRSDALLCASKIICEVNKIALKGKTTVATVGYANAKPGVLNVIPGECVLGIDIRDIDKEMLYKIDGEITKMIEQICKNDDFDYELTNLVKDTPVVLSKNLINMLEKNANELYIKTMKLPSGAGHDAMNMVGIADEVGMIFIPCKEGVSHNINENIDFKDAILGANVLAKTMLELAM